MDKRIGSVHVGDGPSAMAFSGGGPSAVCGGFALGGRGRGATAQTSLFTPQQAGRGQTPLFTLLPAGRGPNAIVVKAFKVQ